MSKVSVLIPAKDCQETIEKSIKSVLNQTYQDFNIILVDNNCKDKTAEIAQDLAKDKIKIVKCQEPGIVPALNTGLQHCNSDYVARQDGDDFWHEEKLEKQIDFLELRKEIDILGTQIKIVDTLGKTVDENFRYPLQNQLIKSWLLTGKNAIAHPSVIFRKRILLRVGGYDDSYPVAEDHHMWLRCIKWFNFSNLSDVLVNYTSNHNEKYDPKFPLLASESQYKLLNYSGYIKHVN